MWFDYALWRSDLSLSEFEKTYIQRGRSASKLVAKWRSGTVAPTRTSALALERVLPETLWLFDLPLFPLLADEPIRQRVLSRHTGNLLGESWMGLREWRLPAGQVDGASIYPMSSTRDLVHRGDIWGLCALVGTVRWAELEGDLHSQIEASQDAFRALPALLRLPWARTSIRPIFDLLQSVRIRMPYSSVMFDVEWDAIEALAAQPSFIVHPQERPRTEHGEPQEYPDPVTTMQFVAAKPQQTW